MPDTNCKRVEICDVGARDGFQFEKKPIDTKTKINVIQGLLGAGLERIQITSFVHPKWVPQMADAEEIVGAFDVTDEALVLSALALNRKGVDRALACGVKHIDLSIATNESHSAANANMSVEEGLSEAATMIRVANAAGIEPQIGLQTVWGYEEPGDTPLSFVANHVQKFADMDVRSISLADSTGFANPKTIREFLALLLPLCKGKPLVLHLHDTRGLGMANVATALEMGVRHFDTSFGGLGGCPFIPGATGNIATEDTAYLCSCLGFESGISLEKISRVSRDFESFRGIPLSGKMFRLM